MIVKNIQYSSRVYINIQALYSPRLELEILTRPLNGWGRSFLFIRRRI